MTRDELIAFLQSVPDNLPVYVKGYEMGVGVVQREWIGVVNIEAGLWADEDGDIPYGLPDDVSDKVTGVRGILISREPDEDFVL